VRYRVKRRGTRATPLSDHQQAINCLRSKARARGEHAFHVVKRLWGFTKVRYRGLAKNTARLFTAFALANLYLLRRRLLPEGDVSLVGAMRRQRQSDPVENRALPAAFWP